MSTNKGAGAEIPEAVRQVAEKSVAEARRAIERMMDATRDAVAAAEARSASVKADSQALGAKAVTFAHANMQAALDLAERMARAKTVDEIVTLQTEFAARNATVAAQQAQDLGSATARLAESIVKPR